MAPLPRRALLRTGNLPAHKVFQVELQVNGCKRQVTARACLVRLWSWSFTTFPWDQRGQPLSWGAWWSWGACSVCSSDAYTWIWSSAFGCMMLQRMMLMGGRSPEDTRSIGPLPRPSDSQLGHRRNLAERCTAALVWHCCSRANI